MKSRSILFLIIIFFFSFLNHAHAFLEKLPPEVIWRIINHIPPNPLKLKTIHQHDIIPDFARLQTMTSLRVVNKYLAGLMSGEDSPLQIRLSLNDYLSKEGGFQSAASTDLTRNILAKHSPYFPTQVYFDCDFSISVDVLVDDLKRLAEIQPNLKTLILSSGAVLYGKTCEEDMYETISTLASFNVLLGLNSLKTDHFLAPLTNLRELSLGCMSLSSISHIPQLTKLQDLHLWGTELKTFPSLSTLTNLKILSVRDNELTTTAPFMNLPHLTSLDLYGCRKLREIDQLSTLTTLQDLNLGSTGITTLQPLTTLQKLKDLDLSRVTKVITFNPLSHLTNLETINVYRAHVDNFTFLENLIGLKRIKIEEGYHDDNDGNISKTLKKRPALHLVTCEFGCDIAY